MRTLRPVELSFFADAPEVIRSEAVVAAARERVFAAIAGDPSDWGDWFPGFDHSGRWESPAPYGVGSVRTVSAFRSRYRETMLAWDDGERWAFRVDATSSPLFAAFAEDYRLADAGPGLTRLTWTVAFQPGPVMRLLSPLAPLIFRATVKRAAAGLTRVAGG